MLAAWPAMARSAANPGMLPNVTTAVLRLLFLACGSPPPGSSLPCRYRSWQAASAVVVAIRVAGKSPVQRGNYRALSAPRHGEG